MPKVSHKALSPKIHQKLMHQFWSTLANLRTKQEISDVMADLLTPTEQLMLAKRLATAILIFRGYSQTQITHTLNVSFSHTGSVANWLKNAKPQTINQLQRLSHQKDWQAFTDQVQALLDKLVPPPKYSNWSQTGRAKHQRHLSRSAKSLLR